MKLKDWVFDKEILNEARDTFIFEGFTGLAFNETYYLRPEDIVVIEGKKWISKNRRKSSNEEPVPLTERYVWPNKRKIAASMMEVEEKLFTRDGS